MKRLLIVVVMIFNVLFPFLSFAVEPTPHITDREIIEKLARLEAGQEALSSRIVDLRDEMKSNIQSLRAEMKASNEALRAEMKASNEALRAEMKASNEALRAEMKSSDEAIRSEMKAGYDALSLRISDLRDEMRSSNEAINNRLDDSYNTMLVFFGSIITLIVALFAYITWDRRTMLKPVADQLNRLEREVVIDLDLNHSDGSLLRRQLQALRQFAGKNPEFAEIMRGLALL
ncbi:conserved exported hypothetical protein [Desulfamplus magnetovallimortis]|uniref:Uncharacterized protein n=1 Tax=Desulfamplus magnetovallimortis TaxID=1246637 RepID=A0A1W1HBC5_9BACT|nr:hypothetical protein [Desulfamplus magnetovallimortis]SLM29712.1 conserved exported hypothetical protein [Desulfamplus magnetovallimortis]